MAFFDKEISNFYIYIFRENFKNNMAKSLVDRSRKLEKLMAAKCRVVPDNVQ